MDNPPKADDTHSHNLIATTTFLEFYYPTNLKVADRKKPVEALEKQIDEAAAALMTRSSIFLIWKEICYKLFQIH